MSFKATKVYRDGYHYVAIPYKENPTTKKRGGVTDFEKDQKKKAFEEANKGIKTKSTKKKLLRQKEVRRLFLINRMVLLQLKLLWKM